MFCRKCGTEFDGKFCPNCGEPVEAAPETPVHQANLNGVPLSETIVTAPVKEPFYSKTWFIVLMLLFCCFPLGIFLMWKYKKFNKAARIVITIFYAFVFIIGLANTGSASTSSTSTTAADIAKETAFASETVTTQSESEEVPVEAETELAEETAETETARPATTKYKASTYKVGNDIPAGEYVIFSDSFMGYLEISKDSNGTLDSIIANDNISTNSIVTLEDGQYFKMTGCYAVPIDEAGELDTSGEGMFKVGVHIPAGEYKVEVAEDSVIGFGYAEISKDSSHVLNSILSNDNFEGSKYITVSDGQYLKLTGCRIVQ